MRIPAGFGAFRCGASAYVLKRCAGAELLTAIREVMRNRTYVTPLITDDIVNAMMSPAISESGSRADAASARGPATACGRKSMKEAANILHIGVRTVEFTSTA